MATKNIYLYVPNIIGYARLVLLAISFWFLRTSPYLFLLFYCSSIILDGFDGYAARKLNQVSTFGAWLDVATDNLSRGMLWAHVFRFGWLISSIEWIVFVCTHTLGKSWQSSAQSPPLWVQAVMANGFKTPIGAFAIAGLHCLPIWFYIERVKLVERIMSPCMQAYVTLCLSAGRLLCFAVEFWFIYAHIEDMVSLDTQEDQQVQETKDEEQQPIRTEKIFKREVVAKPRVGPIPRRSPIRHVGSAMIDMARGREQGRSINRLPRNRSSSPIRRRRIRESPDRVRRPNEDSPTRQRSVIPRRRRRSPDERESGKSSQAVVQNDVEKQQKREEEQEQETGAKADITAIIEVPSFDEENNVSRKESNEILAGEN